jgi:hypothetical protein
MLKIEGRLKKVVLKNEDDVKILKREDDVDGCGGVGIEDVVLLMKKESRKRLPFIRKFHASP